MRLFAAVRPHHDVLDHLSIALAGVGAGPGGPPWLRWVPEPNRHVTVAFYGEAPNGTVDDVAQQLDEACATVATFEAGLRGAGSFGGRTLWIGCTGDRWTELMTVAGVVGSKVLGRAPDRRSRPHMTVARLSGRFAGRVDAGRLEAITRALAVYAGPSWPVGEVVLLASELGAGAGGAPRYRELHRSALRPVAG